MTRRYTRYFFDAYKLWNFINVHLEMHCLKEALVLSRQLTTICCQHVWFRFQIYHFYLSPHFQDRDVYRMVDVLGAFIATQAVLITRPTPPPLRTTSELYGRVRLTVTLHKTSTVRFYEVLRTTSWIRSPVCSVVNILYREQWWNVENWKNQENRRKCSHQEL